MTHPLPALLVTSPSATLSRRIGGMHSMAELLTFLLDDVSALTAQDEQLAARLCERIAERRKEMQKDSVKTVSTKTPNG